MVDASPQRAIWLYCSDKSTANNAEHIVKGANREARENKDWHRGWDLEITDALGTNLSDFGWFVKVFSDLGIKSAEI